MLPKTSLIIVCVRGLSVIWKAEAIFQLEYVMDIAIKQMSRLLVEAVGGVEAAAGLTRLRKSRIQQCISENNPKDFLPIDVVYILESHVDGSYFAQLLADGETEDASSMDDKRMTGEFVSLSVFFGKVMEEYGTSLENDDVVSSAEAKVILKQALELQRSIINIESNLLRVIAESN